MFAADTPHQVIYQILHAEPRAARQFSPDLPRDFETIILKCLAKEPAQRYATTRALAADLRRFLGPTDSRLARPACRSGLRVGRESTGAPPLWPASRPASRCCWPRAATWSGRIASKPGSRDFP